MAGSHLNPPRVLERTSISPAKGAAPPSSSIPLTFFDIPWLVRGAVERLFFYNLPPSSSSPDHFLNHLVPRLKSSLAVALARFYPLAGTIRTISGDNFELYYVDGDSVPFTVAVSDADFGELSGSHGAREAAKLDGLISGGGGALLALQVTLFAGSGVCVGASVDHAASDGSSSASFLRSWAAACRSAATMDDEPPPSFDRSVISDPGGLYSLWVAQLSSIKAFMEANPNLLKRSTDVTVLASFTLTRPDVDKLKHAVAGSTTFVVVCGYVWSCLVKAQGVLPEEKPVHFMFVVDCRSRLEPPAPAEYFGNCLGYCFAEAKAGDLATGDGVVAGARAVGKAVGGLAKGVLEGAEGWVAKVLGIAAEHQAMSVSGSPRLRVYDVDFGWGRPARVEVVSIKDTGGVSLAESGGGGVEIGIALPAATLEAFSSSFYGGLSRFSP